MVSKTVKNPNEVLFGQIQKAGRKESRKSKTNAQFLFESIIWLKLLELFTSFCRLPSYLLMNYKILKKAKCIETTLIQINFIKLLIRCILNLAAMLNREVLKVSIEAVLILKAAETSSISPRFQCKKLEMQSCYTLRSSVILFSVIFD